MPYPQRKKKDYLHSYNLSEKCVFCVLVGILDNQLLEHIYFYLNILLIESI